MADEELQDFQSSGLVWPQYRMQGEYILAGSKTSREAPPGMKLLYNAVDNFVHLLWGKPFPHDLLRDRDLKCCDHAPIAESLRENYVEWLDYEKRYVIVGAFCLLFALISTLAIFIGCCYRSTCGRRKKHQKPRPELTIDSCKRQALCAVIGVLTLVVLFATASAIISNEHVHRSVDSLAATASNALHDLELYRDDQARRVDHLLVHDFAYLRVAVATLLDEAAAAVVQRIKELTGAVSLDLLSSLSDRAAVLERNLSSIESQVATLRNHAEQLQAGVHRARNDITRVLDQCDAAPASDRSLRVDCQRVTDVVRKYMVRERLPERWSELLSFHNLRNNISVIANSGISQRLSGAHTYFVNIENEIASKIERHRIGLTNQLDNYARQLIDISSEISRNLTTNFDPSPMKHRILEAEPEIERYEYYRWLGTLILCVLLCVQVIVTLIGVCYGCCGRPNDPLLVGDQCCTRSTGTQYLCMSMFLTFVFSILFTLIAGLQFIAGANIENAVCVDLRPTVVPSSDAIYMVDRYLRVNQNQLPPDVNRFLQKRNISQILQQCQEKRTLYQIFDLEKNWHPPQYTDDIRSQVDALLREAHDIVLRSSGDLRNLVPADLADVLQQATNVPLRPLAEGKIAELQGFINLLDLADAVYTLQKINPTDNRLHDAVQRTIVELKELSGRHAEPLITALKDISFTLTDVNAVLPNLTADVPHLLRVANNAEALLASNVTGYLREAAVQFANDVETAVRAYFERIQRKVTTDITDCKPLLGVARSTVSYTCDRFLRAFNSLWLCVCISMVITCLTSFLMLPLRGLYTRINVLDEQEDTASTYYAPRWSSRRDRKRRRQHRSPDRYSAWHNGPSHSTSPPPYYQQV